MTRAERLSILTTNETTKIRRRVRRERNLAAKVRSYR